MRERKKKRRRRNVVVGFKAATFHFGEERRASDRRQLREIAEWIMLKRRKTVLDWYAPV